MEEVVPVCDRFLTGTLGQFSKHATDDCITYVSDPESSSLCERERAKKIELKLWAFAEDRSFLPSARLPFKF